MPDLTKKEREAIDALQRIAAKWPETLWLFSANGNLWVMRCGPNGEQVTLPNHSVDQDYCVEEIPIPNDGGDW
jgi:hypothetical protein